MESASVHSPVHRLLAAAAVVLQDLGQAEEDRLGQAADRDAPKWHWVARL